MALVEAAHRTEVPVGQGGQQLFVGPYRGERHTLIVAPSVLKRVCAWGGAPDGPAGGLHLLVGVRVSAEQAPVLATKSCDGSHLGVGELEPEDVEVLPLSLWRLRLGQGE